MFCTHERKLQATRICKAYPNTKLWAVSRFYKIYSVPVLLGRRWCKPILTPIGVWKEMCIIAHRWHVRQYLKMEVVSFSLTGIAKQWYKLTVGSMQGNWEMLCSKFCMKFFSTSKVVSLWKENLNFRQLEEENFDKSWERFNELIYTGTNLDILDPVLLQHFYEGLSKDCRETLDLASKGSFLHLPTREARAIAEKIS